MKAPQRSFVVEFKSGRRQPKKRTNSIWGDTDLRALAREVEDKVPHLFKDEAPGTPEADGSAPADPMIAGPVNKPAGGGIADQAAPASADSKEIEAAKQPDCPATETVAQGQDSQQATRPTTTTTTTRRTPRQRVNRLPTHAIAHRATTELEDESGQPETAADPISFDELAVLDAENKRLKRLLAEQLQAQNLQLRKMLERLEVI